MDRRGFYPLPTFHRAVVLFVLTVQLCACSQIGPRAISSGRSDYAEVINRTEDEQLLNVIVRERYDESFGMMTVTAVTANLRFRANVTTELGLGDSDNYEGNLVPLSGQFAYEESPTITYAPLNGEDFTRRMLTPVSMDEWLLVGSHARRPGYMLELSARRINGLKNAMLSGTPASPEFNRVADLYDNLRNSGVLDVVQSPDENGKPAYFWQIHDYGEQEGEQVGELFDLLGLELDKNAAVHTIPMRPGVGASSNTITIDTRSAFDVIRSFGRGVDVPPEHLEAGIVEPLSSEQLQQRVLMHVRFANERQELASVQVFFRDRWFYIDPTDAESKRAFRFLRTLIGIRLADPNADLRAPVITVPVR